MRTRYLATLAALAALATLAASTPAAPQTVGSSSMTKAEILEALEYEIADSAGTTVVSTAQIPDQITLDAAAGTTDFNCSGGVDCTQTVQAGPGQTASLVEWIDSSDVALMSWSPNADGGDFQFGTAGQDVRLLFADGKVSIYTGGTFRFQIDDKIVAGTSGGPNLVSNSGTSTPAYRNASGDVSGLGFPAEDQAAIWTDGVQAMRWVDDGTDFFIIYPDSKTPATAAATCTTGTIVWDADFIYVCVATDTWKRAAIATW